MQVAAMHPSPFDMRELVGRVPADVLLFAAMPLFSLGATALPHFRALFSKAVGGAQQGERMAVVGALESLPQVYLQPLVSVALQPHQIGFKHPSAGSIEIIATSKILFSAVAGPVCTIICGQPRKHMK